MEEEKTEPKRKPASNNILTLVQCVMYKLYVTFYPLVLSRKVLTSSA
jgi:hypothetical protein